MYLFTGIARPENAELMESWPAYITQRMHYRLVVFESMTEGHDYLTFRPGPLVIRSSSGYVDVINGPRNYKLCHGYSCNQRPAAYFALVAVGQFKNSNSKLTLSLYNHNSLFYSK